MKIKFNDKVVELDKGCTWQVRNGILYNLNTNHDEGVDGDTVDFKHNGEMFYGCHVKGVTCYQLIDTEEYGGIVLSANECVWTKFHHNTHVELVEE